MIGTIIQKEEVDKYRIIPAEEDRSAHFASKLQGAVRLGNEFKSKTDIVFNTEDGPKRIETTVWSLTDKYIQIKNGILIPLKSLIEVEY
ncbi:hypothetical protein [Sphingobacterium lactis]|uniref:Uncharacterized protein n=1 Tax=Sphingobacterium lactis TaxID=797291 RepID=A0A1H6CMW8_9SPHI|nr:hypothetical protein [Sphingobacterium lactis]SEG74364.1 hypothetical protein SAMN05421877_11736 [Sphingobacterium lactis]